MRKEALKRPYDLPIHAFWQPPSPLCCVHTKSMPPKFVDDLKRVQNKLNRVARQRRQQRSRSKSPDQSKKHSSRNLPSKSTRSREEGSSGHKESSSRGRRSDKKKRCISRRSRSKSPSTRFGHLKFWAFFTSRSLQNWCNFL